LFQKYKIYEGLEIPSLRENFRAKLKFLSIHNFRCQKFATSCPSTNIFVADQKDHENCRIQLLVAVIIHKEVSK